MLSKAIRTVIILAKIYSKSCIFSGFQKSKNNSKKRYRVENFYSISTRKLLLEI